MIRGELNTKHPLLIVRFEDMKENVSREVIIIIPTYSPTPIKLFMCFRCFVCWIFSVWTIPLMK